ncbi:MAG: hypothetical protein JNL11_14980 [Bdellovibrionaceae bacterium]|nr:hypothetical protein [Pseudobdellovibrionaceae bacterium]
MKTLKKLTTKIKIAFQNFFKATDEDIRTWERLEYRHFSGRFDYDPREARFNVQNF